MVGYRTNGGRPNPLPQLTLKGRWLGSLGFTTGQRIEVITEPGQLIIRLAAEG
ncbi:SymE family type I addiction module toxin [Serratia oryzae]|uniref:SymE family type I addiction module toxin n=1 Tax=Serratia oryzae TaxID=2034155 RepID=UPI0012E1AB4D|nr:SymE family type I addiction module toxin [Serratia oryzae]